MPMDERTTQERWEKLLLHRDLIIQEANLKGAEIPLNADYPEIILGLQRITLGLPEAEVETLLDSILGEIIVGDYSTKSQAILDKIDDVLTAISSKGVEVPVDAGLTDCPALIDSIQTGGVVSGHTVRFIDYDGTVLKEQIVVDGGVATAPEIPAHENLTFTSWNNTFSVVTRDIDVGATYRSTDGLTHLYATILSASQSVTIRIDKADSSVMTVDFGNGDVQTINDSGVVTPTTTFVAGDYDIKITCSGNYSFSWCISNSNSAASQGIFTKVILAQNIVGTFNLAFKNCTALSSINIPDSITSIGASAFADCVSLKGLVIPKYVTTLPKYCVSGCYSLRNVSMPEGVTSIGHSAFSYCQCLKSIIIPQSVTAIGNASSCNVFSYCQSLTSIKLPQDLTGIHANCFFNCLSLIDVQIPSGVTTIGDRAFSYCKSLISLVLPEAITEIPDRAFEYCQSLQDINIPNGVTMIFDSAFSMCRCLSKITIPQSISAIYPNVFSFCDAMSVYIILKDTPPLLLKVSAFNSINYVCKIYVPDASVDAYKAATQWETFANRIFPLSQLPV